VARELTSDQGAPDDLVIDAPRVEVVLVEEMSKWTMANVV
jgi:hypothetical protein